MRRTLALTAALLLAMACGDATGPLGPLDFGIIQGREQAAVAGDAQLDTAVVAKVWRNASGQAFIGAGPLYAQSTVTGVAGAVVCVGEVPIEGEPIIPHSRCTATLSDGTAVFHLTPPTTAGTHRTPIVAEVDGVALTPDTVTAVVEPGTAAPDYHIGLGLARSAQPRTIPDGNGLAEDQWGNLIAATCPIFEATDTIASTVGTTWPDCRSLLWVEPPADVSGRWVTGTFAVVDSAGVAVGHGVYEVKRSGDQAPIYLYAYGLDRPCSQPGANAC